MACAGVYLVSQQRIFFFYVALTAGFVSQLGLSPHTSLLPTCFPCWPPPLHLSQSLVAHAVSSSLFTSGYWARGEPLLPVIGLGRKQGQRRRLCARLWGQDCSRRATEPVKETQDSKTWCKAGVASVRISCNPKGEYKHVLKLHSNEQNHKITKM